MTLDSNAFFTPLPLFEAKRKNTEEIFEILVSW